MTWLVDLHCTVSFEVDAEDEEEAVMLAAERLETIGVGDEQYEQVRLVAIHYRDDSNVSWSGDE